MPRSVGALLRKRSQQTVKVDGHLGNVGLGLQPRQRNPGRGDSLSPKLRALISPIVTLFWADATFWIPLLVLLFAWKHLARARPFRYSVELWSVGFPLGMYAAASLQFATVFELPFVRPLAHVTLSLCVWALSVIGMGIHAADGARLHFDLTDKSG